MNITKTLQELPLKISAFFILFICSSKLQAQNCNPDPNKRVQITGINIPNEYSCYMEMKRGWYTYYGTGALIHPRVVITAGHNIAYFPFVKRPPFFLFRGTRKIRMYFGSKDSTNYTSYAPVKLKRGKTKFFNSSYWLNASINRDFAIIILPDSSVYKQVGGCYKFAPIDIAELKTKPLHITGSPGDKSLFTMWTDSTNNFSVIGSSLHYDLFTEVRNSGSPIWSRQQNSIQLAGVHSRSFGNCNASVLIDKGTFAKVVQWCKEAGIDLK